MALIHFSSGRINATVEVTRYRMPNKHVFDWEWRGDHYFLDAAERKGVINSTVLSDADYNGEGSHPRSVEFDIFKRHILYQDGQGAFDADEEGGIGTSPIDPPGEPPMFPTDPILVPGPDLPDPTLPGDDPPQVGSGGTVNLSVLVPVVSRVPAVMSWLRNLLGVGGYGVGQFIRVPGWVKTVLQGLGFGEIVDIFVDIPDIDDFLNFGGGGGGGRSGGDPVGNMVEAMTVSTWNANGVIFHRLSDGRLAVRNKHGVWKVWRPKKPLVLFSTGPQNVKDVLKAAAILRKQGKRMAKMLREQGYKVSQK